MRNACQSALRFTLAEAHADESLKGFRSHVGDSGADGAAIGSTVGVGKGAPSRRSARDDERAVVGSAVVGAAEGEEIGDEVFPAFAAPLEMVRLRKDRVPTTRNATFPAVSAKDRATHCRRDGLRGADRALAHVG